MAKRKRSRNRYRQMESIMTKVLILDGLLFFVYYFSASRDGSLAVVKYVSLILSAVISVLTLAWLYLTKELTRRRSLWMVTACICILFCLLISYVLGYPCPPTVAVQ